MLSLWKEPVNGDLSSQRSLPLEVDTDEKHDQKATVNNSFCSKTKPAGPLGNKGGGWFTFHCLPASLPPPCLGSCWFQSKQQCTSISREFISTLKGVWPGGLLDTPTNHFISYNKNKVATTTSFFLLQTEPCKRYFQTGRPLLRVSKFKDMK